MIPSFMNCQTTKESWNFAYQMQAQDRVTRDFVPPKRMVILDTAALDAKIRLWRETRARFDEVMKLPDPFMEAASAMFGVPIENITPAMRKALKVTVYGALYS